MNLTLNYTNISNINNNNTSKERKREIFPESRRHSRRRLI